MSDKTKLEELRAIAEACRQAYRPEYLKAQAEEEAERYRHHNAIYDIREKWRPVLTPLQVAVNEAERAVREEQARLDIENAEPPYPVGTTLVEWASGPGWSRTRRISGRTGLMEIATPNMPHPSNQSWLPGPGAVIVRILKKDGKPSLQFDRNTYNWYPEGVDPNEKGVKT